MIAAANHCLRKNVGREGWILRSSMAPLSNPKNVVNVDSMKDIGRRIMKIDSDPESGTASRPPNSHQAIVPLMAKLIAASRGPATRNANRRRRVLVLSVELEAFMAA